MQMRMLRLRVVESVSYASQKGEAGLKLKSPDTMQIFFLLEAGKCLQVISEQILCPAPPPLRSPALGCWNCDRVGIGKKRMHIPKNQLPIATTVLTVDVY